MPTATTEYPLSDLLYRSAALTDASGAMQEAYDTDAYGSTLLFDGPGTDGQWFTDEDLPAETAKCHYVFTGREYDFETQIYFYRARYYHPHLGRFIERDPYLYGDGPNLYQFSQDSPQNRLDALGTASSSTTAPASQPCYCGPDITNALNTMVKAVNTWFDGLPFRDKVRACIGRYDSGAWDTDLFTSWNKFKTPDCPSPGCPATTKPPGAARGQPVTVNGQCFGSFDVNYLLWGIMNSRCGSQLPGTVATIFWKAVKYQLQGTAEAMQWVNAAQWGYFSIWPTKGTINCTPCKTKWNGVIGFRVSRSAPTWWPNNWLTGKPYWPF